MLGRHFPEPRSAYLHIPFCKHRCGYCDFTVVSGRDDLIDDYLRALDRELQQLDRPRMVETIFLGGGTPTHLSAEQLSRLMDIVRRWLWLTDDCEFTAEANPDGLTTEKIDVLADAGVNRVSLGVQSFDAEVLNLLERDHRRSDVHEAVERLRRRIDNISIDLIFGVSGQTLEMWKATLREGIELQPQHVSTYGLTFEKGTRFWSRLKKGELQQAEEELERAMYAAAMDDLARAGFLQYEISNFARPGFQCRHNEVYWKGKTYYGFGPGAARYVVEERHHVPVGANGVTAAGDRLVEPASTGFAWRRETNHRSAFTWMKRIFSNEAPIGEFEELSDEDRASEMLVLGLRRVCGVGREEFRNRTGLAIDELAGKTIERYCRLGLLEDVDSHIRLTREGRFLADTVFVDFL